MEPLNNYYQTDLELLNLIQMDDKAAFKELYKRYWSKLYVYAYNVLKEKDICEDIIQEIFVNLWERRNDVQIINISAYLYQSLKYKIFNHFRNSKYKRQLLERLNIFVEKMDISNSYEIYELTERVENIISKLPEQRRKIFRLSRNENFSNKEIAQKLGISIQTVKNQISQTLKTLRESLKKH